MSVKELHTQMRYREACEAAYKEGYDSAYKEAHEAAYKGERDSVVWLFVENMLKGTDCSLEKIASIANVPIAFVEKVKQDLSK
jgi:hypothetical protein